LPGFLDKAEDIKAKGVDEIAFTSVNDAFVMGARGKANDAAGKVTMLADGNADFAKSVGLTFDGSKFGMGERSQRYSMIVNDGVVEELNVEAPGEFKVSSAEHLLEQL
jgi:peroxiredoxin